MTIQKTGSATPDAVEMADMMIEAINRAQQPPEPWWSRARRFVTPISRMSPQQRARELQGAAGRRARTRDITYRGLIPPNTLNFTNKFGAVRNDYLDWETINIMRRNPMIKLGLTVRAAPIFTALREAKIKCDDPDIAAFIKEVFVTPWLLKVANSAITPAHIFGSAPHEKVWKTEQVKATRVDDVTGEEIVAWNGPALIYKNINFVRPETLTEYSVNSDGSFNGFTQRQAAGDAQDRSVPFWKAFVYSNNFVLGRFWGESEMQDAYPSWYYASFFRALLADYIRLRAIPPIIGNAPSGSREGADGQEVDNLEFAGEALLQAFMAQVVILPWESDPVSGLNQWSYKELEIQGRIEDTFTRAIEELEVNILRGLLVPERTVTQNIAAVGSYNQAETHREGLLDMMKLQVDSFLEAVNTWLIPQLVEDNFGANAPKCTIFSSNVSEALKEKLFNVLITLLQNDTEDSRVNRSVSVRDLLEFLDIPFTVQSEEDLPTIEDEDADDEVDESPES